MQELIGEDMLQAGIEKAAKSLLATYGDNFLLVYIKEGAVRFAEALLKHLPDTIQVSSVKVESYLGTSSHKFEWIEEPDCSLIKDKLVVLVDDIFDTGKTMLEVTNKLISCGAKDIATCVMLSKDKPRDVDFNIDCSVFHIPDEFVIGFGLDLDGKYRDLNAIYSLNYESNQ